MTPRVWDVAVVGAGPAGCAAAAAALQREGGADVLLLDRRSFPRDKPCGDGIAAEALDVLSELGFDVDAITAGYPPMTRLRLQSPTGTVTERDMRRAVRVIPREVFDARLVADVVARGAVFQSRRVRTIHAAPGGTVLDGELRARVTIGADGAESQVRRAIGTPEPRAGRVAVAIRGYAPELPGQDRAQWITMAARHWPAYAWSFPLGDGRANVGYGELLTGRALTRAAMLNRMRELLPGVDPAPSTLRAHRLPMSPGRPGIAAGRVLLAGDALSMINPLSGEGIFYAVRTGALAGFSAAHGEAAGATYRQLMARTLGRHLSTTDIVARLSRAPRLIDAGIRAAASSQAAFDDLVRLSLADGTLTVRLLAGLVRGLPASGCSPRFAARI